MQAPVPFLGHGVGLRAPHFQRILAGPVDCDWFEAITENYAGVGGNARRVLLVLGVQTAFASFFLGVLTIRRSGPPARRPGPS